MAVVYTGEVRRWARRLAAAAPAGSICESSQPPKMSAYGLASAGMAMARSAGSVLGGPSGMSEACMANANVEASGYLVQAQALTLARDCVHARGFAGIANRSRLLRYLPCGSRAAGKALGGPCMSSEILTPRKGPVLEITLNRPQIGNAASDAMAVELTKLLLGAAESPELVVLRAAADDSCVGCA